MHFSQQAHMALLFTMLALLAIPERMFAICRGDCGNNGGVSADELARLASIINLCGGNANGCAAVPGADKQCLSADADTSGVLTAGELTRVVRDDVITTNPQCAAGLGTRSFTIAQRPSGFNPPTGFYSTGVGATGGDVTQANSWYVAQPLLLRAGTPDANGIAAITLEQDVIFGWKTIMGGPTLCAKLLAAGSGGQLDCDGNSSQDVLFTVDSKFSANSDPAVITPFSGLATSRPGALTLTVMATVDSEGTPALAADCVNHQFGPASPLPFTTETATTLVTNAPNTTVTRFCSLDPTLSCGSTTPCPAGKGTCTVVRLAKLGQPFRCSNWTEAQGLNAGGILPRMATPLFGEATPPVGDTANILQISD